MQEVTGSSPVVSTKKNLISDEIRFFLALRGKAWPQNLNFAYKKSWGHICAPMVLDYCVSTTAETRASPVDVG